MHSEKKLYRAKGSLVGGVCAGFAEYFNIDPVLVQILTVVLTVISGGLLAVAYFILWIALPLKPTVDEPLEVHPHEVHSETYGQVPYYQVKNDKDQQAYAAQTSQPQPAYDPYAGVAHVPPTPPAAQTTGDFSTNNEPAVAYATNQAYTTGQPYTPAPDYTAAQTYAPPAAASIAYPGPTVQDPAVTSGAETRSSAVSGAFWVGLFLLFVGLVALFGTFVSELFWWQLLPLLIIIGGVGMMVVPGKKGHRMERFVNGLMLFTVGVCLLFITLGFVSCYCLPGIFMALWPLLIIMCGFFILGTALKAPFFVLLGGLTFVAFCFIGFVWFSTPGTTEILTLSLPTGKEYVFDLHTWLSRVFVFF